MRYLLAIILLSSFAFAGVLGDNVAAMSRAPEPDHDFRVTTHRWAPYFFFNDPATCSLTDVSNAVSATADGGSITIPDGNCTWNNEVSLCKNLTISGTSQANTVITINNSGTDMFHVFLAGPSDACTGKTIRFTKMKWVDTALSSQGFVFFNCSGCTERIDHITGIGQTGGGNGTSRLFWHRWWTSMASIDNNTLTDLGWMVEGQDLTDGGDSFAGKTSWTSADPTGSNPTGVYIEDNSITFTNVVRDLDCENGCRVFIRHNTFTKGGGATPNGGTGPFDHGYDSVSTSGRWMDINNNNISGGGDRCIQFRGGTGVVWNNLCQGSFTTSTFEVTDYRSFAGGLANIHTPPCNGTNSVDGNTGGTNGYRCNQQVGSGASGASDPLYTWNNWSGASLGAGSIVNPVVNAALSGGTAPIYLDGTCATLHIQCDRDIYQYKASFTGASGTGSGVRASRPATCTTGVAYYSTDAAALDKCTSTNTWTNGVYVSPTYPNPLQGAASGIGSIDQSSYNFGNVRKSTTTTHNFTFSNIGSATLTVSSITAGGDYTISSTSPSGGICGGAMASGATCTITVQFGPSATGSRTATLTITSDASNSPTTSSLSGTGIFPAVSLSPSSISFGSVTTSTTSAAIPVTLTNSGTDTLNISSISITGTDAAMFAQSNNCGSTLGAGLSCAALTVTFSPSSTGSKTASLSVASDATTSPDTVSLSGTGAAPAAPATQASGSAGTIKTAGTITIPH